MAIITLNSTDTGAVSRTTLNDNFTDLDTTKADLDSPTFTGTPTLPTGTIATTQSASDNSTKVATTAYVDTVNLSKFTIIQKTSDETVASDDTFTADSQLAFSMAANTAYSIRANIGFSTSATADIKFEINGPASPTNVAYTGNRVSTSGLFTGFGGVAYNTAIPITGTSTGVGHVMLDIIVQNGANAGTFSIRWAQNTLDASNTTVLKGSTLEYKAQA